MEIRRGKSLGLFTRPSLIGTLMGAGVFIAAIPISASAQTSEDAALAASHRDSLLEDATLAASQRDPLQNRPKMGKAGANPSQQDVVNATDQSQPHQEPQSATPEALPAPVPTKPQAENEQAAASQNQAHRSPSESARPQRIHRTRETKTRNSAASTPATPFLSQLRDQWNRIWHTHSNSKRSDYHQNQ